MRTKFVHFDLNNGYLDHWLVAGPQKFHMEDKNRFWGGNHEQVARQYDDPNLGIETLPVERGSLDAGVFTIGEFTSAWDYFACQEDHRVDQSAYVPACAYLRSWAYLQISSKEEQAAVLEVTSTGPMRIWLNDENIHHHESFAGLEPERFSVPIRLRQGTNPLFVRFENFGAGQASHFFTARVAQPDAAGAAQKLEIYIPSLIKSIGRRNKLERSFHSLYLNRDVIAWDQEIHLHWPPAAKASKKDEKIPATIRLTSPSGRIYAQAEVDGTPGDKLVLGIAGQYPEGLYEVLLMPQIWEFYDQNLRITHKIPLWNAGRKKHASTVQGSFESRRKESLEYAASQEQGSVERETARMALARWNQVDLKSLTAAVERVTQRFDSSLVDLLGLLGFQYQFGEQSEFPADLKAAIQTAALGCRFDLGEEGSGALGSEALGSEALACGKEGGAAQESRQLLTAVCQILAGQAYPQQEFFDSGLTGSAVRQQGEQQAMHWLQQRAAWGFAEWGAAPGTFEILAGLTYLLDFAESESAGELAAAVMDKLFFTIALNTYQGLYGGTSSRANALSVKGGQASAFSAVAYLMWGQGMLSPNLVALVPLACSQSYRLPDIFAAIATQPPEECWSKERHTTGEQAEGVNQAAYKTPDYLLASAQSYRPGEAGRGEHVWQATLGPGAVVFTNHPGSSGESEAHLPGYWRGNGALPRIAQWKDALISIYHLPETAALPFTHAYFPTYAFDETELRSGWAFARKGSAYLALTSAVPFHLRQSGPHAQRELVAPGSDNAWFCQMGRAARDGDFAAFQNKVLSLQFTYQDAQARCTTLAGDQLELGWSGSFRVNQSEQALQGFRHYENPYTTVEFPSGSMEILVGSEGLRLNLE